MDPLLVLVNPTVNYPRKSWFVTPNVKKGRFGCWIPKKLIFLFDYLYGFNRYIKLTSFFSKTIT